MMKIEITYNDNSDIQVDCENTSAMELIQASFSCFLAALQMAGDCDEEGIKPFLQELPPAFSLAGAALEHLVRQLIKAEETATH